MINSMYVCSLVISVVFGLFVLFVFGLFVCFVLFVFFFLVLFFLFLFVFFRPPPLVFGVKSCRILETEIKSTDV